MSAIEAKRRVAEAAVSELPQGGVIGLGSGSTASLFIERVGQLVAEGRSYRAVATSKASHALGKQLAIPMLADEGPWDIEVTVDGADEVDRHLNVIKGGGAAHTREKIVNYGSRRNVIIVDASKLSARLGEKWPVPIEVLRFAHGATRRLLSALGDPTLRLHQGEPLLTDNGNYIYDLATGAIEDVAALDRALHALPGVVETGLFVARADVVLVSYDDRVERLSARERGR